MIRIYVQRWERQTGKMHYNTEEYFNRFSKIIDEILRKNDNNEIIR